MTQHTKRPRRSLSSHVGEPAARCEQLRARARTLKRRKDKRGMLVALREACMLSDQDAATWTLYGARLAESGRMEEARKALGHAHWLRRCVGDERRAAVLRGLLDEIQLSPG